MKHLTNILLFIWTLPQTLLGYIMVLCLKAKYDKKRSLYCFEHSYIAPVCLGEVILINTKMYPLDSSPLVLKHEGGHQKQSRYLGWLYLLVVGLPSITLNIISRYNKKVHANYHNYFPENWADKLAKIKR